MEFNHQVSSNSSQLPLIDRLFAYFRNLPISDAFILKLVILVGVIFFVWTLISFSSHSQVEIPSAGGSLIEGVVGTPRFVNPVLAFTRADRDLTALTFDGLLTLGPAGTLIPNIAESITMADDGLAYNVIVRKDIRFHDNTPLTATDVSFTVGKIKDPGLSSPLRANFEGVTVEQISDYELNFILPEPYAPFLENLTFGILPQHVWKDATVEEFPFSQLNSSPIGSGPYAINKIIRNASGIPESYELKPHQQYHLGAPRIQNLTLNFYSSDTKLLSAFNNGTINSVAGLESSQLATLNINPNTHTVHRLPLPRTFTLFFNQNRSTVFRDQKVREALNVAIDREALIERALGGYGVALTGPVPPWFGSGTTTSSTTTASIDAARAILRDAGWKVNTETGLWEKLIDGELTPLAFSIATANAPVFEATAEYLKETWGAVGASVTIRQFEQSDLTQGVIRPRDYEALLFGTVVGRALDFYSFWHSSQRNDPGLNVALYTNITTDPLLVEMRRGTKPEALAELRQKFSAEVLREMPAIFLYSPELTYVFPNRVVGANFTGTAEPYERFASIHNWFTNTEFIWPIFKPQS